MQHLGARPKKIPFQGLSDAFQAPVRFLAYHRIKPHAPPLVRAPVNSFEFRPCDRIPGGSLNAFAWPHTVYRMQRVIIVYGVDYQGI